MTLDDPKYATDFAHTVWQVSTHRSELETLDFLSENAARNISYLAAKAIIDVVNPALADPDTILTCFYIPAEVVKQHALGSVLSTEWRFAFGREFVEKVREAMLRRIEREKQWAIERAERETRIAQAQEQRRQDEIARARKVLEGVDNV